ncbi:MAG TPA: response regulator [Longimicrobiaceae bacterium]|nr:response regulator [Longimicrobiaceae bacterium]
MADVLYADDDEMAREMVASVLAARGHSVRVVRNGDQALAEVRRSPPDLVLLDYRMGEPDGFAVCRELKESGRHGHIPVLILTGEGEIDQRLEGFDAGADDYLAKPVDSRELVARVGALLELSRRALHRNPSSGLPGGDAIGREFDRRRQRAEPFAVCYLDFDNFKPFGERFGFAVSDSVIHDLGDLLRRLTAAPDAFAGHVGGDDFIVFCRPDEGRPLVEEVQRGLRERLARHLPEEVVRAGGYVGRDRSGEEREFPLTSISAAIVRLAPEELVSLHVLGEAVSELKDRAKRSGSGGVVEVDFPFEPSR